MFVLLFGFWLILNGSITTEIVITGLVLCAAVYLFCWRFLGYSIKKEWKIAKRGFRLFSYLIWLIGQIFVSSYQTIKLIWSPNLKTEPQLISFKTKLRTQAARVLLSDSITLTPGTITVGLQDDELLVHCLDESFAEDIAKNDMQKKLIRLEGERKDG